MYKEFWLKNLLNTKNLNKELITSTINNLNSLGEGFHKCGWFKGWIEIKKKDKAYSVIWCSHKYSHDPLVGSAISVEYHPDGIGLVCKSAISMWPVNDESERLYWAKWLSSKIEKAVKRKDRKWKYI